MGMEESLVWLSSVQLCYSFKVFLRARYGFQVVGTNTPNRKSAKSPPVTWWQEAPLGRDSDNNYI